MERQKENLERLSGVVERITYHNPENGWTVLKVAPFREPGRLIAVLIHQAKVFAGATMEFHGTFSHHPKHGEQFKAVRAIEKKPASAAALEKYLGSGLIKGVGPAIAKRIVNYFQERTLEVFDKDLDELLQVPGIAEKKLRQIRLSWEEHKAIRDVMIFLQGYGISTLFATRIFKAYGNQAIEIVSQNPYRLAHDIDGIGFFSADRIALSMGFERMGRPRIEAGIKHVLAASRDRGHCYLTDNQICAETDELLQEELGENSVLEILNDLNSINEIKSRILEKNGESLVTYYSKSLYFDEVTTAKRLALFLQRQVSVDQQRVSSWISRYCAKHGIQLSEEQLAAVCGIVTKPFSILTGGPGCGKTTTTRVLAQLLVSMKKKTLLAAPTGRAAQRMTEVIGLEAKTLHRLLEWAPDQRGFKRNEKDPLDCDFLIIDETSMLDISLSASVLKAVPLGAQILFIGDPDQLPAVGAGNVLMDLLQSGSVPRFRLTQVFRQAQQSSIVRFAHEINHGQVPKILSPLSQPSAFREGHDCLFVDADEATADQIRFLQKAKSAFEAAAQNEGGALLKQGEVWTGRLLKSSEGLDVDQFYRPEDVTEETVKSPVLVIPDKYKHVDLAQLSRAKNGIEELSALLRNVHPWSSLHYGMTAVDTVLRLYKKTLPEWLGKDAEIQVLTPQVRGSLGTINLNGCLQAQLNPESPARKQLKIGDKILRLGDRVIQTRNNYDLGVFNGDIGVIADIDLEEMTCEVLFQTADAKRVIFKKEDLTDVNLAYAITIHKSQGSEFQAVIIPVLSQHFTMLFRNLIYTGLTRAKKLAVFVGSRKAFVMSIRQIDNRERQTALTELLQQEEVFLSSHKNS